jgi:hypothetical protein
MSLEQLSQLADPIGAVIGFVLTLMVLSYIIGDNFMFRLAIHIGIGVAAGFAVVLIMQKILWYKVVVPLVQFYQGAPKSVLTGVLALLPALLLTGWILTKASPRLSRLGTPVLAFVSGVGAATVIGGALFGTLLPQITATTSILDIRTAPVHEMDNLVGWLLTGIFIVLGTVTTLSYFHFGVRVRVEGTAPTRHPFIDSLASIGQGFIAVTMGVIFASVLVTALIALIERVNFLWSVILDFLP